MSELKQDYLNIKEIWKQMTKVDKKYKPKKQKKNQGRLLWNSSERGTYVKKIHGELK